jgi:hypothetical protein
MAGVFTSLPVWTTPPDWSGGVLERLEWLTDVLTSSSGAEQRSRRRQTPRRSLEMGVVLQGPERTLYGLQIKAAGASDWYIPLWHDIIRTPVSIVAGLGNESPVSGVRPLSIAVPTFGHDYAVGGLVILYSDVFDYEIAVIYQVQTSKLVLTVPTNLNWPAGTRLMPLMRGRLTAEPAGTRVTDQVLTARVSFTSTRPNQAVASLGTPPTYQGFPVLLSPPDESTPLAQTFQRMTSRLDNQTGLTLLTDTAGFGFTAQQHRWFLKGLAEHAALRSLLYALHGRQTPLWVPTFGADLELVAPVSVDTATLIVKRCGYSDFPTQGRSDIAIQFFDGTALLVTIVDSAVEGETEVLILDPTSLARYTAHRYWRLSHMAIPGGAGGASFGEVAFASSLGGVNLCAGGTASASSVFDAPYVASAALDGNPATLWSALGSDTDAYWQYDFGAGVVVREIRITARSDRFAVGFSPTSYTLQWSDDGAVWTTVETVPLLPFVASQVQTYSNGTLTIPFSPEAVLRISFMALCRQDSDIVEIAHQTDAVGVATVATTFREAPDLRNAAWDAFNPLDCAAATLANFDQTVNGTGGHTLVRGRQGKRTGKWYFEGQTPARFLIAGAWIGVCTLDATYAGLTANAVKGCLASSFLYGFEEAVCGVSVLQMELGSPAVTTMGLAVDLDNKRFWARANPLADWNNDTASDPAADLGGWDFSSLGDVDLYPCVVGDHYLWVVNFGMRPFVGQVPAGFNSGWSAT